MSHSSWSSHHKMKVNSVSVRILIWYRGRKYEFDIYKIYCFFSDKCSLYFDVQMNVQGKIWYCLLLQCLFQCWICLNVLNKVFKNCTVRCLQKILNITFVEEWKKNPFETRYIILNNAYRKTHYKMYNF